MTGTLSTGKTPHKQNSWLSYLHEAGPKPLFDGGVTSQPGLITYEYPPRVSLQTEGEAISAFKTEAAASRTEKIDIDALDKNLAAIPRSQSLKWERPSDFDEKTEDDELMMPPLHGEVPSISKRSRGSVLHRCLEDFTKTGKYDLSRIIREFPDLETADRDVKDSFISKTDAVLQSVLRQKKFEWIFKWQSESYSELPFLYRRGHSLISGKIDRIVIKEGKGFVIDYKSSLREDEGTLKTLIDHYRPQLNIYCEAVKEIFKLENVEGYLLFLDSNRLESTKKT
jgi:ATP-dependent exoDNAse (exonuclease V) beta subunit